MKENYKFFKEIINKVTNINFLNFILFILKQHTRNPFLNRSGQKIEKNAQIKTLTGEVNTK